MRIKNVDFFAIDIKSVKNTNTDDNRQAIIIIIHTENGLIGLGEAASISGLGEQNLTGILVTLKNYRDSIVGQDAGNINLLHQVLDKVDERFQSNCPTARAAIDMAIFDVIGKHRNCSVHQVLGGAYRKRIELMIQIEGNNAETVVSNVKRAIAHGYSGIIISLESHAGSKSLADTTAANTKLLLDILDAVGNEIYVCADARQSMENASLVSRMFADIFSKRFYSNLTLQQPLLKNDLTGHARLRETLPIPVQLSTSIVSVKSMMQVELLKAADRVALSLENVGGFKQAMSIAHICEAAAIGVHPLVSTLTPIGMAAHLHLAAALHDPYPVNIANEFEFDSSFAQSAHVISDGVAILQDAPGLGINLNEDELRSIATIS
jgi:L-alanine-DL-glutamate epimerase-like enolase superfamily enzyme